jgi:hypothetical protein
MSTRVEAQFVLSGLEQFGGLKNQLDLLGVTSSKSSTGVQQLGNQVDKLGSSSAAASARWDQFIGKMEHSVSTTNMLTKATTDLQANTNKMGNAVDQLGSQVSRTGDITVLGRDKFISYSNMVEGSAISALHASGAVATLDRTMAGIPSVALNVVNALDNISDRSNALGSSVGAATKQIGGFGSSMLIAGAAFVGWTIGAKANELMELDGWMGKLIKYTTPLGLVKVGFTALGDAIVDVTDDTSSLTVATESSAAAYVAALARMHQSTWQFAATMREMNEKRASDWAESQLSAQDLYAKKNQEFLDLMLEDRRDMDLKEIAAHVAKLETMSGALNGFRAAAESESKALADTQIREAKRAADANTAQLERIKSAWDAYQLKAVEAQNKIDIAVMEALGPMHAFESALGGVQVKLDATDTTTLAAAESTGMLTQKYSLAAGIMKGLAGDFDNTNAALQEQKGWLDTLSPAVEALTIAWKDMAIEQKAAVQQAMIDYLQNMIQLLQFIDPAMAAYYQQLLLVAQNGGQASEATNKVSESMQKLSEHARIAGEALGELAQQFDGVFGAVLAAASSFADAFASAIESGMSRAQAAIAGAAAAASSLVDSFAKSDEAKKGAAIGGAIGSIAGSFFGPLGTIVGGALGKAVGAFIGHLFSHDWAKDVTNVLDQFGIFGQISEGLQKQLEEDAKALGDAGSAAVVNIGALMQELGVSQDTFAGFINALVYGFDAVNKGFITAEQQAQALADAFPQLADAAIEFGGAFIDQLDQVIQKIGDTGIGIETLQAYMATLQAKIDAIRSTALTDLITQVNGLGDAFSAMLAKMQAKGIAAGGNADTWQMFLSEKDLNLAKHRFGEMLRYFDETVASMRAQRMSMAEIFRQVGPLWDELSETAKRFGFNTSKEFKQISLVMVQFKEHAAGFARLDFLSKIAADEVRLGVLTKQTFHDVEASIFNLYNNMTKGLTDAEKQHSAQGKAAIQSVLPSLIQVIGMHNQTGMAISANDQKLIELAQKYGLLPKDTSQVGLDPTVTAMNAMLEVMKKIQTALDTFISTLTGIPPVTDVDVNVNYNSNGTPPPGTGGWDASNPTGRRHASGPVTRLTASGWHYLDPGDIIIPPRGNPVGEALNGSHRGGGSTTSSAPGAQIHITLGPIILPPGTTPGQGRLFTRQMYRELNQAIADGTLKAQPRKS